MIEFRFLWDIISVNISIRILMPNIYFISAWVSSISENREVWRLSKSFLSCNIHLRHVNVWQKCGISISPSATPTRIPIANRHVAGVPGRPSHPLSFQGYSLKKKRRAPVTKSLTRIPDLLFVIASEQGRSPSGQLTMPPEKFTVASWLQFYEIIMKRAMALGHMY